MKSFYTGLLILLLTFSFIVRVWDIDSVPPGLYWDEMDVGYQAYSILKTGKDYFGNTPFLTVHSFADFRAPVLIYLTIPFVAVFGLTPIAVRLPSAILGTLTVLLMYLLTYQLFKDKKTSLIAALLTAFVPWNIQYSRMAFEAIAMLVFFLGGLICFFKGLVKPKWLILSAILFSLSLFTYNTTKLFVPIVILSLAIIYFRKLSISRPLIAAVIILTTSYLASLYGTVFLNGGQRFAEISIFTDPQNASQVDYLRHRSSSSYDNETLPGESPRFLDKLIYNKPSLQLDRVIQNYLKVFSTNFLFLRGDQNLRHSTSAFGEFYRFEIMTILLGLAFILINLKKRNKSDAPLDKVSLFLLIWIVTAPIAAVVTRDGGNHATRLFLLFPALTISSALGAKYLLSILSGKINKVFTIFITLVWVVSVVGFLNFYFGTYKIESVRAFQYGFKEAITKAIEEKGNYEYVVIDDKGDSSLMHYLFISKYDPARFQSEIKSINTRFIDFDADKVDNVIMLKPKSRDWENIFNINLVDKNYLLIISSEQLNEETPGNVTRKFTPNQKLLDIIYYKTGTPAFYIISSKVPKSV